MKKWMIIGVPALLALFLIMGCEWGGVSDKGVPSDTDADHDGMPDDWEIAHFGNITISDGTGDFDGDGFTDLQEYLNGTDPTKAEVIVDEATDQVIETSTDAGRANYVGVLPQTSVPVVPGSMTVSANDGAWYFNDNGAGELVCTKLGGVGGDAVGYIKYATGAWGITFGGGGIPVGKKIRASWKYVP